MSKSIKQLLMSSGFFVLNKKLVKIFGIEETFLLTALAEASESLADSKGWFYKTAPALEEETGLSVHKQTKIIDIFLYLGILEQENKGMPMKRYFKINFEILEDLVFNNSNACIEKINMQGYENFKCKDLKNLNACIKKITNNIITNNKKLNNKNLINNNLNNKEKINKKEIAPKGAELTQDTNSEIEKLKQENEKLKKELEKAEAKNITTKELLNYVYSSNLDAERKEILKEWIEYKAKKGQYKQTKSIDILIKNSIKFSVKEFREMVEHSIMSNYTGIAIPKTKNNFNKTSEMPKKKAAKPVIVNDYNLNIEALERS